MYGRGQILAVTSSKGGIGKTHLAVGLSAALAKRDAHVLLIDTDLGNGIISDRLGLSPQYNLAHFFLGERALEDLIEETPLDFSLIAGDQGNFALANHNYLQEMKFLRNFVSISRNYDFVLLDLPPGISRQTIDLAILADRTIIVTSPNDLLSGYASVRGCFSRFTHLEATLFNRVEGYKARQSFRPLILINHVTSLYQGEAAFEALESAVEKRLNTTSGPFGIKMGHLGSIFYHPGLFKKSEDRRCPVSMVSAYSKVAICMDSIASVICSRSPFRGFHGEDRVRYIMQIFMEQQERFRRGLTQKITKISPIRIPFHHGSESIAH